MKAGKAPKKRKIPSGPHIGTFRKVHLNTSSRRLTVRLLSLPGFGEKQQLENTLILMGSQGEKAFVGKKAFGNSPGFRAPIEDLPLIFRILGKNSKNKRKKFAHCFLSKKSF
jgi:hypothetical protein